MSLSGFISASRCESYMPNLVRVSLQITFLSPHFSLNPKASTDIRTYWDLYLDGDPRGFYRYQVNDFSLEGFDHLVVKTITRKVVDSVS